MQFNGPPLETLLHRLSECPEEFLQVVTNPADDGPWLLPVVCDLLRRSYLVDADQEFLEILRHQPPAAAQLTAVACWLFDDRWFQARNDGPMIALLFRSETFAQLAALVRPDRFVSDPDRREELVRTCLAHLQLRPQGETVEQATDRLNTLNSYERSRVLRETAAAEKRAREIREAMERRRAQESASRYGE